MGYRHADLVIDPGLVDVIYTGVGQVAAGAALSDVYLPCTRFGSLAAYVNDPRRFNAPPRCAACSGNTCRPTWCPRRSWSWTLPPLTVNGKLDTGPPRPGIQRCGPLPGPVHGHRGGPGRDLRPDPGHQRVRIDDSFFDLGGHSLSAMRMTAQVQRS